MKKRAYKHIYPRSAKVAISASGIIITGVLIFGFFYGGWWGQVLLYALEIIIKIIN